MSDNSYGHFEVRQPIGRVRAENGEVSVPSKFGRRPVKFQPLTEMNGVYKATRVSSSTTPKGVASSDTQSNDAQTVYGEHGMSGQERHFMSMLESSDITAAEADSYFDSYFS
jgi:hypothetical protein